MINQLISDTLTNMDREARQMDTHLLTAEAAKALTYALLALGDRLNEQTRQMAAIAAELQRLNARLDTMTAEVRTGQALRVYDAAKIK